MRSLTKEKRTVYVSQPLPPQEILDDDGNGTGVMENVWDEPVELSLNVKPITDKLERQAFGTDVNSILKAVFTRFDVDGYDVVENSAAWIGVEPNGVLTDGDAAHPMNHNYIVDQLIDSGGQTTAYFKKVSGAPRA